MKSLLVQREAGFGRYDYIGNLNKKELPDQGARIEFEQLDSGAVEMKFGYKSPDSKWFGREIKLDLSQVITLRNFLNETIDLEVLKSQAVQYVFLYNEIMALNTIKKIAPSAKFILKYKLSDYKLYFVEDQANNKNVKTVITRGNSDDYVYGAIYTTSVEDKLKLNEYMGFGQFVIDADVLEMKNGSIVTAHKVYNIYEQKRTKPDFDCIENIIKAARESGIPEDYITKLKEFL